ncbi:surface polysaccharide O-acyltransferase-like enzyme [Methanobrevibacter gottschalkii DSM 11977]|uniref:Surface polysaccharide O-acyltransferase-like enzyme n=2 Tax=Methanobrevibacter TaxID=2172 RepID=A0A3N5B412_9EURY|nr:acyltransferase family protein [Methanobrevibacter gottschalkii]RPF52007.1 surface polysaccharide O-acyltransferase-like enzyme [Methanobrevibacter gottschalkii DSM 11977]
MYKVVNGRKRIFYLDFIRALAIILVVLAHVTRAFFQNSPAGSFNMCFVSQFIDFGVIGVPLFLMISGALLLNKDYELGDFLKRRYSRVLVPFLFWAMIFPISKILFEGQVATVANFIKMYFDSNFWFVWMILGVYLFIPIINSFIKEYDMRGVEYFLLIWGGVMFLNTIGQYPFHQLELSYFAGYLGYFVLGYYLANKKFRLSDSKLLVISLLIFLTFTFINIDYTITMCILKNKLLYYKYETIVTVVQSAGLFMFIRYFALVSSNKPESIKNRIYLFFKDSFMFKIIFSISTFSYGIYLAHYNPLFFLKYEYKILFTFNPIIWLPIMMIAIIGSSWFILWIFDKIPGLRNINGAH